MAKIVVFAGPKGGSGKSTGATNFAAWLSTKGEKVALIDADPNKQAYDWAELRRKNGGTDFPCEAVQGEIRFTMQALSQDFDWVVVDTPGVDTPEIRRALGVAHAAVFPCKSTTFDRKSMPLVDFIIEQVQSVRPDFAGLVYHSETPAGKAGLLARQKSFDVLSGARALRLLTSYTTARKAYAEATDNGFAAFEQGDPKAAQEFHQLAEEIVSHVA